jgi:hypothetical protein
MGGDLVANPFNPETRPRHHLETARITRSLRNSGVKSGFNQPRRVKPVQPGKPRVGVRQMAGQRPQVAIRRDDFGKPRDLACLDGRPAHGRLVGKEGRDGLLAFFGLSNVLLDGGINLSFNATSIPPGTFTSTTVFSGNALNCVNTCESH